MNQNRTGGGGGDDDTIIIIIIMMFIDMSITETVQHTNTITMTNKQDKYKTNTRILKFTCAHMHTRARTHTKSL
jgi:hypothetical protein